MSVKFCSSFPHHQGYVGTVMLGKNKYIGVPCPSADEAKQSAAAIANTTLPVSSLTQSLNHCLTHSLAHSTHSLTRSLAHSLTHSLPHSLTHSITHSLTHSLTHSFTHSITNKGWNFSPLTATDKSFSTCVTLQFGISFLSLFLKRHNCIIIDKSGFLHSMVYSHCWFTVPYCTLTLYI